MKLLLPIFSENFLSHYLVDFRLSSVTDIRGITLHIKRLIKELDAGKIDSLKEEEIKSRFVTVFFGDILGFNYGNSNKWLLREEKKSVVDGTKPDAALGYFFSESGKDDVRAIIEIKDASTKLEAAQKRDSKLTPIDQAFNYAAKMGGNCKWVILSNIKEIRFYSSLDRSRCQSFLLEELGNEDRLKELLFLFHKDRFIKENLQEKSGTDKLFDRAKMISEESDKPIHIIDRIYNSLKRFEGFGFVNPIYLSTIAPFNILDDYVWHYNKETLFTINPEIFDLMSEIIVEDHSVSFSEKLQREISTQNLIDSKFKIEWSFRFLNHCMVDTITAIKDYKKIEASNKHTIGFSARHAFHFKEKEGITSDIKILKGSECDCISCNFRNLNFKRLLSKLKTAEGNSDYNTMEYAFGNYLIASNNYKTTYTIYKWIAKESKGIEKTSIKYFLSKLNIKLLQNLIIYYDLDDKQEIFNDIKSVDLDRVIYDEIEFDVDKEVRKYMMDVKDEALIYRMQDKIDETLHEIEKLRQLYKNGGKQSQGPNLPTKLLTSYLFLYYHINGNYIIYDGFTRYKSLTEKVLKGLIISSHIPKWGIEEFNEFFLTEAVLHINSGSFQELLKNEKTIRVNTDCIENLLNKLNNLTSCIFDDGLFNEPYENSLVAAQLINWDFMNRFTDIFSNMFTLLQRMDISKEQFLKCITPLIKFIKIENVLAWYDLKQLGLFITFKGYLFDEMNLAEILKIAINRDSSDNNKYDGLVEVIPLSLSKFHSKFKIDNVKLINTSILNCTSDNTDDLDYRKLVNLSKVCDDRCKQVLFKIFESHLDATFDCSFYESLLYDADYDVESKNYFYKYCEIVNKTKDRGTYRYGKLKLTDLIFINFILTIYNLDIDFEREDIKLVENLNDFEKWILNPDKFDYTKFDVLWLTDLPKKMFKRLKNNTTIQNEIENKLIEDYSPDLAEIKYKYFKI